MTNEELVQAYQSGDDKALDLLLKCNKNLIHAIVNKFNLNEIYSYDDLVQEGFYGLIKASKKYDFSRDDKCLFSSFAYSYIKGYILSYINRACTKGNEVSLQTPTGDDLTIGDTISDTEYDFCNIEDRVYNKWLREEIKVLLECTLENTEKMVIELKYGINSEECTYEMIEKITKLRNARAIKFKALNKIRRSEWYRKNINIYKEHKCLI